MMMFKHIIEMTWYVLNCSKLACLSQTMSQTQVEQLKYLPIHQVATVQFLIPQFISPFLILTA